MKRLIYIVLLRTLEAGIAAGFFLGGLGKISPALLNIAIFLAIFYCFTTALSAMVAFGSITLHSLKMDDEEKLIELASDAKQMDFIKKYADFGPTVKAIEVSGVFIAIAIVIGMASAGYIKSAAALAILVSVEQLCALAFRESCREVLQKIGKLPAKHEARSNPGLIVRRQRIIERQLPKMTCIINREGVVFEGETPIVSMK